MQYLCKGTKQWKIYPRFKNKQWQTLFFKNL